MIYEIILCNRLYKTNDFARIKPRIAQDKVVMALTDAKKLIQTGTLTKVNPKKDTIVA